MRVIDFRFRPNTPETIHGIQSSSMFKELCKAIDFGRMQPQPLADIAAGLRGHGVELAVITGRDCETTYGAPSNNTSVRDFCRAYPDLFVGFWGMDPHKGMAAVRDLARAAAEDGVRGAAVDPYLARIPANDARYYPIYAKCCELALPIVFTTGPASFVPGAVMDHVAPRHIDCVARDFPELRMVISHGGYPWVGEAIMVVQRNPNVYMEISEYERFPQAEAYVQAANSIIGDKLLFASAHPFVDFREALATYAELPFSPEVRDKVLYHNAARLLGRE